MDSNMKTKTLKWYLCVGSKGIWEENIIPHTAVKSILYRSTGFIFPLVN